MAEADLTPITRDNSAPEEQDFDAWGEKLNAELNGEKPAKEPEAASDAAAAPPPKAAAEDEPPDSDTSPEDAEEAPAEATAAEPGSPRDLLMKGDLEGAIAAAVQPLLDADAKPEGLEDAIAKLVEKTTVRSPQWAAWRKKTAESKQQLEQREASLAQQEQQLAGKLEQAVRRVEPFYAAAQAFQAGDLDTFAKHLGALTDTGITSFSELTRWGLHKVHGSDPEKETLKRKLTALEQRIEQDKQQQQQAAMNAEAQQRINAYKREVGEELTEYEDPILRKLSSHPKFLDMVVEAQLHNIQTVGVQLPNEQVIEAAFRRWNDEVFGGVSGLQFSVADGEPTNPPVSVQGGSTPVRPAKRRALATTLKQKRAAEPSPKRQLTEEEQFDVYAVKLREELHSAT